MSGHSFFLLGFCLLLVHEMDAMGWKERRVFPVAPAMGYEAASSPPCTSRSTRSSPGGLYGGANRALIVGLNDFFVVHVLLHLLSIDHPEYRFGSAFS